MNVICPVKISAHIKENCSNPNFGGLEQVGYIINKEDIDAYVRDGATISSLVLKTGAKAYAVQNAQKSPFNGTATSMTSGNAKNTFNRTCVILVPSNDPETSENVIDKLANGSFVVILENQYKNTAGDNAFEVFGIDKGLKASAIENDKYAEETDGGWKVTLVEEKTPHSATFLFASAEGDPTIVTTRAYLDAMLAD